MSPEVLGGQLAPQQHRSILAHRLLDHPAALSNAGNNFESAIPELLGLLLTIAAVQEPAREWKPSISLSSPFPYLEDHQQGECNPKVLSS